jgi:glyoxylase-like metal-dependent hydrolase (beta-lactamase superfamily II)/ferredoxin
MASINKSHPLNLSGPLFTDTTCIDCGTCFHLGPELFQENEADDKSIVIKQPENSEEWQEAKRAVLSCPTNSIGVHGSPQGFHKALVGLPLKIADEVFYLGYTSRDSFGASAYLIRTPNGNIMIDSPRFHPWPVKEIEQMGGIKWLFLTHQDDVADHEKFHKHFNCTRIIHRSDLSNSTAGCEMILEGVQEQILTTSTKIIMTPGHTEGHMVLLYNDKYLFTGDHLFVDRVKNEFRASKSACWFSWDQQIKSMEKLHSEKFEWVLPGHGAWGYFSVEESHTKLASLLASMKGRP